MNEDLTSLEIIQLTNSRKVNLQQLDPEAWKQLLLSKRDDPNAYSSEYVNLRMVDPEYDFIAWQKPFGNPEHSVREFSDVFSDCSYVVDKYISGQVGIRPVMGEFIVIPFHTTCPSSGKTSREELRNCVSSNGSPRV